MIYSNFSVKIDYYYLYLKYIIVVYVLLIKKIYLVKNLGHQYAELKKKILIIKINK